MAQATNHASTMAWWNFAGLVMHARLTARTRRQKQSWVKDGAMTKAIALTGQQSYTCWGVSRLPSMASTPEPRVSGMWCRWALLSLQQHDVNTLSLHLFLWIRDGDRDVCGRWCERVLWGWRAVIWLLVGVTVDAIRWLKAKAEDKYLLLWRFKTWGW
jgi:hypothetical protein